MPRRRGLGMLRCVSLLCGVLSAMPLEIHARLSPTWRPPPVAPQYDPARGVVYHSRGSCSGCGGDPGGFIECSRKTWWGETLILWTRRIYTTVFDVNLERDVQGVRIQSLTLNPANDTLAILASNGLVYSLRLSNLTTVCPENNPDLRLGYYHTPTAFRRMPLCNSVEQVYGMSRSAWAAYWAPAAPTTTWAWYG